MKNKEPVNIYNLLLAVMALVLGIFLCINDGENVKKIVGYVVSGILLITGLIKIFIAFYHSKKYEMTNFIDYLTSILIIIFGTIILINPGIVVFTLSIFIGSLLLIFGTQRLIMAITVGDLDKKGSLFYILESILLLLLGLIIITGKAFSFLGILLIVYSLSELISYIYYTSQNKGYAEIISNKKVTKEMKNKEAKDAIVEE